MSGGMFDYQDEVLRLALYKYSDAPCNVFEDWVISELVWSVLDLIHCLDLYKSGDIDEVKYLEAKSKFKEVWFGDNINIDDIRKKVITKRAKVTDYWLNDLKRHQNICGSDQFERDVDICGSDQFERDVDICGYDQFERDVNTFLRGYNEAVEDILNILGMSKLR